MTKVKNHYRADIDGLRALAVLPVLFFHFGLGCPGGYVGVDVFFVISGYLISGLIMKDAIRGEFSIFSFWERRIRRIFPALYVMVFFCVIAGYFLFLPWDFEDLGRSATMQSLFASNFHFWSQSGYFDGPAEMKPLLHTWSLAVEEQFYFIFPALLCFLYARLTKHWYKALCVLWILSFIVSVIGVYYFPYATFFLLPMRSWELLSGVLLALHTGLPREHSQLKELLGFVGVGLIVWACFFFDASTSFPGAAALLPCVGAVMFIWSSEGARPSIVGRFFSLKPLVFIGLISYSLYLWHWPIVAFANRIFIEELSLMQSVAMVVVSFVLAILSWKYVETPFRVGGLITRRKTVYILGAGVSLTAIAVGTLLDAVDGMPSRVPESVMKLAEQERNEKFKRKTSIEELESGDLFTVGPANSADNVSYLVWGDSHAGAVGPAIEMLADEYQIPVAMALNGGYPPLLDVWVEAKSKRLSCELYNRAVLDYIKRNEIKTVFMAARWGKYRCGMPDDPLEGVVGSKLTQSSGVEGAYETFDTSVYRTVQALLDEGVDVYILRQVPNHWIDVPREIADRLWRGYQPDGLGVSLEEHDARHGAIAQVFAEVAKNPRVTILDPTEILFKADGVARLYEEGQSLYRDEDHLSDAGAIRLMPLIRKSFESVKRIAE